MFKKYIVILSFAIAVMGSFTLFAQPIAQAQDKETLAINKMKVSLEGRLGVKISKIKKSPMKNVLEILTNQGLFYVSADGNFLLQGKMYGLGASIKNLTDESLEQVRVEGMKKFSNDMIVFPAKEEKYVVTIFTDITCGYCRKLHEQIDEYNNKGITVRYLAYPRSGLKDQTGALSKGFQDLRSIWCHENPQEALTKAKSGGHVAQRICDKPVAEEFNFGRQVGVSGTPAIMFSNGMMLPGYQTPDQLLRILQSSGV